MSNNKGCPYPKPDYKTSSTEGIAIEKGWQEGWDARCAWEQEPCTEHPKLAAPVVETIHLLSSIDKHGRRYYIHRYQCQNCMEVNNVK